ncbi:hypothetical protein BC829DRAFT_393920, partial [Chytridium lagenaria]
MKLPVATFGPFSASNPLQCRATCWILLLRCSALRRRAVAKSEGWRKSSTSSLTPLLPTAAAAPGSRPNPLSYLVSNPMTPTSTTAASHSAVSFQNKRRLTTAPSSLTFSLNPTEQFKAYRSGRMTLYLASEIAHGITFFGRIKRTYRNENWPEIVRSILEISVR